MKKFLVLLLALLMVSLSGCGAVAEDISIVATFYPVYVLAENVLDGVEGVSLSSMTPPSTGCLHDYQLLTSDMRSLAKAQALLINGAGMESFLSDVTGQFPKLTVIDCSVGVDLIAEEEEDEEEEHEHGHDHGEYNAHIWLAPENAIQMVKNLRDGLSALLPDQAERIAQNAEAYIARLSALDAELRAAIEPLPRKEIVTFHEAFPYFARAYGLEVKAVVALEPDEPVSPRMLKEVIAKVKAAGNPPLFSEPQYESAALRTVALETGAPVYELDPLVTGDGEKTAYEDVMRKNLQVLREALSN
ncbi:MAG: zinc ABC transporter substrate-binding protein [Clostridia bacterium]|nr:zinc ABC transporter substrate-binding protein [Clostridia bacterium]